MCSATKHADDRGVGQYAINLLLNLVQQTLCLFDYMCLTRRNTTVEPCVMSTMDHRVNKLRSCFSYFRGGISSQVVSNYYCRW